jgi:cold shock CspA family protein
MAGPMKTGTIEKIDLQLKSGFIMSDDDQQLVYFAFEDVLKDVGLGVARVGQMVQFRQEQDASQRAIAKRVAVLPAKAYQ